MAGGFLSENPYVTQATNALANGKVVQNTAFLDLTFEQIEETLYDEE